MKLPVLRMNIMIVQAKNALLDQFSVTETSTMIIRQKNAQRTLSTAQKIIILIILH